MQRWRVFVVLAARLKEKNKLVCPRRRVLVPTDNSFRKEAKEFQDFLLTPLGITLTAPFKYDFTMTQRVRGNHVGSACSLHYGDFPLRISRGSKQYIYDENTEYLDCVSTVSHVGHCHPLVVRAGCQQMSTLTSAYGFLVDVQTHYVTKLIEKLPEKLSVIYFTNSGSEANDLAIRLARNYTKANDILVVDGSFHGNLQLLTDLSPKYLATQRLPKPEWVHVVPAPSAYRGKYRDFDHDKLLTSSVKDFAQTMSSVTNRGRKISAFLCEPMLSGAGMIEMPENYLKRCFSIVREKGGLCISDEVVVGLGRNGETFWAFQEHGVVPDILVLGKAVGNGYPLGLVITSKQIADSIPQFNNTLGGNPVACAVGAAVIDVIHAEQLQQAAKYVGRILLDGLRELQKTHSMIGEVRGKGLAIGVEIVTDPDSRKPAPKLAAAISYRLRVNEHIILANEGPYKNVFLITPPMCFTCENARRLVSALGTVMTEIEAGGQTNGQSNATINLSMLTDENGELKNDISWLGGAMKNQSISGYPIQDGDNRDGGLVESDDSEEKSTAAKVARYEDVD